MSETKWTPDTIKALLDRSNLAVEKAIVAIYNRQTIDEKALEETTAKNGVGFSGADAEFGSSLAKWLLRNPNVNHLSEKQMKYARRIAKKYTRQLVDISNNWRPNGKKLVGVD